MENGLHKFTNLGKITADFGVPTRYEGAHQGIDIANKRGTPIKAPVTGSVVNVIDNRKPGENNFGNTLTIKDSQGNHHQFNHLHKIHVKPGQIVQKGSHIASMGDTGSAYSPSGNDASHLDYRIADSYGKYMNPLTYVKNL